MIVLIDNYDSFSYNLVQMIGSIEPDIQVVRNDQVTADDIENMKPSHLILSPGPGYPRDAGILEEAVMKLKGKMPILGVCLGHQGICEAFGGTIAHAKKLMHGKQSDIRLDSHIQDGRFPASEKAGNRCRLFEGLPPVIPAARYHSLSAVPAGGTGSGGSGLYGRRGHGSSAQGLSHIWAAVPSRIHIDAGWKEDTGELP